MRTQENKVLISNSMLLFGSCCVGSRGLLGEGLEMSKRTGQEKVVGRNVLILLGIMGIMGIILIVFGVFAIFEISLLVGLISLIIGIFVYLVFFLIERKLKLL